MSESAVQEAEVAGWPELLRRVAEIAGQQAGLDLAAAYGGTDIYIPLPQKIGESHELALVMGLAAARQVARELGGFGTVVSVPMGPRSPRNLRRVAVARMTNEGFDQASIARALKCSRKTVMRDQQRLRAQRRPDAAEPPRQGSLF